MSLWVETDKEDKRTNSIVPKVCHSIDKAISMSSIVEIIEYKNSISIQIDEITDIS